MLSFLEDFIDSTLKHKFFCFQVPLGAECSPSNVNKIDLNQIEGAVQDVLVASPTHPAVDLGNQI